MQLKISDAARAYGVARSTLHRAIKAGRISASRRGDGVQVIDLAELIRYWGEPPHPPETQPDATAGNAADTGELVRELRALRSEVERLREELRALPSPDESIIRALRRRIARWIDPEA
ncbi:MAG: helix-turn-helix domain-containing protein [Halorhodospira sp.]